MAMTYGEYLHLDELLGAQHPQTDEHDELLFVVIHQVYELWFKQILHETTALRRRLEDGDAGKALHTSRRIAKILKTIVGQLDVLETMTPRQFAAFRPSLGTSSGFQSEQFRRIERTLANEVFASLLVFLKAGDDVQAALRHVYDDEGPALEVCESLVDIDEGLQEWRYRHVKMVERIIGALPGTGGSAGADYLRSTLFRPTFPELWAVRGEV